MHFEVNSPLSSRTLRFRLMTWNALVVLVTAVITLLGVREGVRITLIRELDQLLLEDAREIELAMVSSNSAESPELHAQLDRKDAGHAQHKWFVVLFDAQRNSLYQSQHAPQTLKSPHSVFSTPQTVQDWRVMDRKLDMVTIRVGSSLQLIRTDIGRIDRLVALAAAVVLLIAPLCGYWLAGRATRPLNTMISTMANVHPSRLDERLPIRGTGDELDRLSAVFNDLLDRIGSYLQEHRDLLANSAHELRTPLAAIRSSVEVALAKDRSGAEYTALLSEIIEESTSFELLVNQLLLLSETGAEQLKVHAELLRFDTLVERAVDMFAGAAEYRHIELRCPPFPEILLRGNPQHLRQVIYNLLDNALKFTGAGGQVELSLRSEAGHAILTVVDTGRGMATSDLSLVFDRFFRGASTNTAEVKGTGLGLSICQAIVRAHNGSIEVASELGKGSCFTVKLPLA